MIIINTQIDSIDQYKLYLTYLLATCSMNSP